MPRVDGMADQIRLEPLPSARFRLNPADHYVGIGNDFLELNVAAILTIATG